MSLIRTNNVRCPVCKLALLSILSERVTPGRGWTIAEVEPMTENDVCECAESDLVIRSKYDEALMDEAFRYN